MNRVSFLIKRCALFDKLAQMNPNQTVQFYSKVLIDTLKRIGAFLPDAETAENVFDSIAKYNSAPGLYSGEALKNAQKLLALLQTAQESLKAANVDPQAVLKQTVPNINPQVLTILETNLKTLIGGKDFKQYKHFTLLAPGQMHPSNVIDIDKWQAQEVRYKAPGF